MTASDLLVELEAMVGTGNASRTASGFAVRPGSAAEVALVVGLANQHGAAAIPLGRGVQPVPAGARRERLTFLVDLRRLCHVVQLDEVSLVVEAQAGLTGLGLEQVLGPRGLSLGDFPPAALAPTLGGLLAVRTPGKSSGRHGSFEEAVLGLSAVLPDGRLVHTRVAPRRATGPDLARALCGTDGTTGIITSVILRLHRRPEARFLASYRLPSFADALAAVRLALREEAAPAAVRVFDRREADAHFGPGHATDEEAILVVATAGPTDLAACDRDLVASAAHAVGGESVSESLAELWWRRRTGHEAAPVALPHLQVGANPRHQVAVYEAVGAAVRARGDGLRAHASRFEADGAVLFFTLLDAGGEPLAGDRLGAARGAAEPAAASAGGHLLGDSPAGLLPYWEAMARALDPRGVMAHGRGPADIVGP